MPPLAYPPGRNQYAPEPARAYCHVTPVRSRPVARLTRTPSLLSSAAPDPGRRTVFPAGMASARSRELNELGTACCPPRKDTHETAIPTFQDPPETAARFSGPQSQKERAGYPEQSPARGPQAVDSRVRRCPCRQARLLSWGCRDRAASSSGATSSAPGHKVGAWSRDA